MNILQAIAEATSGVREAAIEDATKNAPSKITEAATKGGIEVWVGTWQSTIVATQLVSWGVVGAAPPDTIRCAIGGVVEAATWAATWAPTRTAIDAEIR